jgi:hypothetical protein
VSFEETFDKFIDRREYDSAENALFSIVRIAFKAGWMADGGNPLLAQPVVQMVYRKSKEINKELIKTKLDTKDRN